MFIFVVRLLFVLSAAVLGYWLTGYQDVSWAAGFIAFIIVIIENNTNLAASTKLFFSAIGLMFGLILATLILAAFPPAMVEGIILFEKYTAKDILRVILYPTLAYFGIILALKHVERFRSSKLSFLLPGLGSQSYTVLDTNVAVDDRIVKLAEADFLKGNLIVPIFVLEELQHIADSADLEQRQSGRKGLDNLNRLRELGIPVEIYDRDYPYIRDVDSKLVQFAKDFGYEIITNDFNLNKVAAIQGVKVININELAHTLKAAASIGDIYRLYIVKEGKEEGQGIGYLDDGTIVVVEEGLKYLDRVVEVVLTGFYQTSSGRMAFGKIIADSKTSPRSSSGDDFKNYKPEMVEEDKH